jgi:catechol 2,3-dioxygenase-like lactoylglutathione lyase family enzyme
MSVSVRYIVDDVDRAIQFYTTLLGFTVDLHRGAGFAGLSRGELKLLLSTPEGGVAAGPRMPDGSMPAPGGWLRFQLEVPDIEATVNKLIAGGGKLRGDIVRGHAAKLALVEDPAGNPVELAQPYKAEP